MTWNKELMEKRLPALVRFALKRGQKGVAAVDLMRLPEKYTIHAQHRMTALRWLAKLAERAETLGVRVTVGEARRGKRGPKSTIYVVERVTG